MVKNHSGIIIFNFMSQMSQYISNSQHSHTILFRTSSHWTHLDSTEYVDQVSFFYLLPIATNTAIATAAIAVTTVNMEVPVATAAVSTFS